MDEESNAPDDTTARQPDAEPDRMVQPVDAEEPPRLPFPVVGIGASAGGLEAVGEFLDAMRPDGEMAFVLVQHLPPDRESLLAEVLARRTAMPVVQVEEGMAVEPDHIYVIRPGRVLTIRDGRLHLGAKLGSPRAANRPVDDFFRSLAEEQRERAVCVVMSGMGSNGTAGAQAIKAVGGLCIAQDPESAQFPSMPRHLIDAGYADYILRPADLPDVLLAYAGHPYARGGRETDAEHILDREGQHFREIQAVLRTRTRRDFAGYKKPTFLRRVQRRMGLARVASMAEYARLLRQSPTEVSALADDLLIHVTGFFRDPEAWEALRREVVAPLVAAREPDAPVRGWVTACSSGEEAYSLGMLLVEEAERAGKPLDIKVFATDLAERALAHARAGVYPGGIESEIGPERLARFFTQEDAVYRVRPDLRDRVVFAPQNVLQDPPFSRLDVASCRNLLIYLEPHVQQRVLGLLHFGLREGGALFLGSSETVAGAEDMFEPIDKKARIFRRVGPTRHGAIDFPLPHAFAGLAAGGETAPTAVVPPQPRRHDGTRASLVERARRTLLEQHTPPAVTVHRDGRVLHFHGDTHLFLRQPEGEPARDVLLLAREGLRGAVRAALHQAAAANGRVRVAEGWLDAGPGRRMRVAVTASPVVADPTGGDRAGPADHFIVSFEASGEEAARPPGVSAADGDSADELRRLRAEYHGAIEELQTSNEELKAAHEEAVSVNEELQSANEELETSKEEMQSLNEELATVNAQLRAKMEEHQATSSDLSSLLASTDIAVLFLDSALGIRRFTPAVRELLDLIPGDVGRPLSALARRFDDPRLDDDARVLLERLVPAEREVAGADGRHYLRRVLPYRTTDNRIDGVVVTFVDITARVRAEDALRASEEQFRRAIEEAPIPVIMQAEDGRVLQVSRTWTELTGYALADVPTFQAWLTRAYGPGAEAVRAHMHELFLGDRKTLDVEFSLRTRGDDERYWSFSASAPGRLRDGRRFVVGMAVDITERRRAEAELRAGEERQAFLLGLSDALRPLADPEAIQAEACRLLGMHLGADRAYYVETDEARGLARVRREYLRGDSPSLAGEHRIADFGWVIAPMRAGRTLIIPDVSRSELVPEADRPAMAALRIAAHMNVPLVKGGELVGALCVTESQPRDWAPAEAEVARESAERIWAAIERARSEAALRESEGRLRLALAAARMGTWALDVATGTQMRDPNLNRLLGLEPVETRGPFAEFLGRVVHPDDREAVAAAFAESVEPGRPLGLEFRVVRPDGAVRWLRGQGDVFREADSGSPHLAGACVDITDLKEAEAAVREREERLRLIVEGATDYAIFTLDADRRVTSWSPGARAVFGYADEEIVGRSADLLFTPEDRSAGVPEAEAQTALRQGRAADERWHARKDGTRFYASGVLTPLGEAGAQGFVKVASDLTERKRVEDALREARDDLEARVGERTAELARANGALRQALSARKELLRRVVTAQEEERRRISRELHDGLGQELTALSLGLRALQGTVPDDAGVRSRLAEVESIVSRIGREAHELAVELRPTALDDIGLASALSAYVARWSERTGIVVGFEPLRLDGIRLPPDVESTVYRVVQEALNNVAKHAEARRVSVIVERSGGELTALVEDDGRGFDPAGVASNSARRSLGLLGMRERVRLVGGSLLVDSAEGEGTTVRVRIPLEPPAGEADHAN